MKFSLFLSSVFGVGFIPVSPGTFGAIFGVLSFYLVEKTLSLSSHRMFTLSGILFFFSILVISQAQKNLEVKDDQRIVLDEVLGMWSILCFIPTDMVSRLIGFILFRFFDVLKPLGIREIQKLPDGWGVVFDDLLAGFYTIVIFKSLSFIRGVI